jgi:hypothetical protein
MPQFDIFNFITQIFWTLLFFLFLFSFYFKFLTNIKEKDFFYKQSKKIINEFNEKEGRSYALFDVLVKFFFPKK